MVPTLRRLFGCTLVSALALACARQYPPPASAPATTEVDARGSGAEPTTLEQAEAELERARAELEALGVAPAAPAAIEAAPPEAAPPPAASSEAMDDSAPHARERAEGEAPSAKAQQAAPPNPCETACRAFASLQRAKDAVCRLEQPAGDRCARAEAIVRDARARVQSCACSP